MNKGYSFRAHHLLSVTYKDFRKLLMNAESVGLIFEPRADLVSSHEDTLEAV
jgi:hypothetical protein